MVETGQTVEDRTASQPIEEDSTQDIRILALNFLHLGREFTGQLQP